MRKILVIATAVLVFAVVNGLIYQKENVLKAGTPVYLKLAPRDPRSLIQGDYMVLRYEIAGRIHESDLEEKGKVVIRLDENNVAEFVRLHDGELLNEGECLLEYRKRGGLRLGAESFFFQEGQSDRYREAKYALLMVAPSGKSVLSDLRGENLEILPPLD